MSFTNDLGQAISFDCVGLIKELKADIAEFGGEKILEVVTEERQGVTIYKDYSFIDNKETSFKLSENEQLQKMTASSLLLLYEQENSIV